MKSVFQVNACRLCLQVDVKVFMLGESYKALIESIFKLKGYPYVLTEDQCVCYICMAFLSKISNFIQTVCNAQNVVHDLLKVNSMVTVPMLKNIDRNGNRLNLMTTKISVMYDRNYRFYDKINIQNKVCALEKSKQLHENKNIRHINSSSINDNDCILVDYHSNENVVTPASVVIDRKESKDSCLQTLAVLDEKAIQTLTKDIDASSPDGTESVSKKRKVHANKKVTVIDKTCNISMIKNAFIELDYDSGKNIGTPAEINNKNKDSPLIEQDTYRQEDFDVGDNAKSLSKSQTEENKPESEVLSKTKSSHSSEKKIKRKTEDEDYIPESTSHSEDSDFDSYDDEGKRIKKPADGRVYPRKCDHCECELLERKEHYHHYLFVHPNIEYPYGAKKIYACSICGKLKSEKHIRYHELEHMNREIKCTLCTRVFSSRTVMLRHKKYEHAKHTYTCDYCSKIFKARTDILRHLRIHTGEKPFKCHICGAGFAHSGNRTIHIRSAHQNLKYVPKKGKQSKQTRKNKQHDITDTDTDNSDDEQFQKKRKKTKKFRRSNKNKNTDARIKTKNKLLQERKREKSYKNEPESKKDDFTDTEVKLMDEKQERNYKKRKCPQKLHRSGKESQTDSKIELDNENLAKKKRKTTRKVPEIKKVCQSDSEVESDEESLAQLKSRNT